MPQVHRAGEDTWYQVQDLHVTDILPQMVALSETYLQVSLSVCGNICCGATQDCSGHVVQNSATAGWDAPGTMEHC